MTQSMTVAIYTFRSKYLQMCASAGRETQKDFIDFQNGFLGELDAFEMVNEDWNEESKQHLFTGGIQSAMAFQIDGNWEPISDDHPRCRKLEGSWDVLPTTGTPVVYQFQAPNFDSLNKFIPHGPKKKGDGES